MGGPRRSSRRALRSAWCCPHPTPSWAAPASQTTSRTATLLGRCAALMQVRDTPNQPRQLQASSRCSSDRPCQPLTSTQAPRTDTCRRRFAQHRLGRQHSPQGRVSSSSSSSSSYYGRHLKSSNQTAAARHFNGLHATCTTACHPASPQLQGQLSQRAQWHRAAVRRGSSVSCRPSCGAARALCRPPRGRETSSAPSRSSSASRRARWRSTPRTDTSTTRPRRPCSGVARNRRLSRLSPQHARFR